MQSDDLIEENKRLQAEVERLKEAQAEQDNSSSDRQFYTKQLHTRSAKVLGLDGDNTSWFEIVDGLEALQSELTKARELLESVVSGTGTSPGANKRYGKIREFLSNQSAPALIKTLHANGDRIAMEATIAQQAQRIADLKAGKGQGEPVSYEYQDRQGKWRPFMSEKHHADTLAEGTWPVRALYAEQPAPVAVVMPEHRDSDLRSPVYGYARGWNACLDELVRLNPGIKS